MSSEDFQIQKEPVYDREQSASKLFGWTTHEMVAMFLSVFIITKVVGPNWIGLTMNLLALLWIKKLKDMFPERYFSSMWKYYTRSSYYYRANSPDYEWRPPIK